MMNSLKGFPIPTPVGQVGGHEGVGKVAKLGPGCESSGLKIGDRVGIKWVTKTCGNCPPCLTQTDALCYSNAVSGYVNPGTFQQYVLTDANYATRIPGSLSSSAAAPMLCAGLTTYAALRKSDAKSGEWVVILGAGGGLGHIACQLSARGFAHRVIGIDDGSKEKLVLDSGAEHFIDITKFSSGNASAEDAALAAEVKRLTSGLGAHAAIVCTSSNRAYAQALRLLRFKGTLVCVGAPEGKPVPIASAMPGLLITRLVNIVAVAVGNRAEAQEVLDFAERGIVKAEVRVEKMERLTEVFREMAEGKLKGRVVLDLS